jgi:putative redox protein
VAQRSVEVRWKGEGLQFRGTTAHGEVDLVPGGDEGGVGATPMALLLLAVGGCTAMDVVSILTRMRQPLRACSVQVIGEKADGHPGEFTSIEVVYRFEGALDEAKVRRAIALSEEKYCSVEVTIRGGVPLSSRFVIEP